MASPVHHDAFILETAVADALDGFAPPKDARAKGVDLVGDDGRSIVEVKRRLLGTRDLRATILQLALAAARVEHLERGVLVAAFPRMSSARVVEAWTEALGALRPDIAQALSLVAVASDGDVATTDDPAGAKILAALHALHANDRNETPAAPRPDWTPKTASVWLVLAAAWLRGEGFLPVTEIMQRAGVSDPTARAALDLLASRDEVGRSSNRSVGLTRLPLRTLGEIGLLAPRVRRTQHLVDGTGRKPDPVRLSERIRRSAPDGVAFGGIIAARHYTPRFDLNGLPRVDVVVSESVAHDWLERIDPALEPAADRESAPVLAIHSLGGRQARFADAHHGLPIADPADTLLDLLAMRLGDHAADLIVKLRSNAD